MLEPLPVTMVGAFGPVASGKTFLVKHWLESMPRAIVLDVNQEYEIDKDVDKVIIANPKELVEYLKENEEKGWNYRVSYVPDGLQEGFAWVVEAAWQMSEPRWLILEEVHNWMSPYAKHPAMERLMRYSRKRGLGVVGTSQRLASVHKDFTASSRQTVLFQTDEPGDKQAVKERYGEEALSALESLRPLVYDDATGKVSQTPEALVHRRGKGIYKVDLQTGKESSIRAASQREDGDAASDIQAAQ
jgi:hypothetical protein